MSLDFKKILEAWKISANPNEKQAELAKKRLEICEMCPSKNEILKNKKWSHICKECGCPINKKIFTNNYNECPLGKWESIDTQYFKLIEKNKKTIL